MDAAFGDTAGTSAKDMAKMAKIRAEIGLDRYAEKSDSDLAKGDVTAQA